MTELSEQEIKKVIRVTVLETLQNLGIDVSDPIEAQKDFAFMRAWRESTNTIKRQGLITGVSVILVGILGLVWYALTHGGVK